MRKQLRERKKKPNPKKERSVTGVTTARQCGSCGHHEIGIVTGKGDYLPLKPGMKVKVIGKGKMSPLHD
jgi:hypothetical protein